MKNIVPISLMVVALLTFGIAGCGPKSTETNDSDTSGSGTRSGEDEHGDHDHEHGDHDHGDHTDHDEGAQTDMEKMKAELAKLPSDDAASAMKQHVCPVTGEMLGTMGAPSKVDVNGQQVWICCDGCKDKLLANPEEYLAKLTTE